MATKTHDPSVGITDLDLCVFGLNSTHPYQTYKERLLRLMIPPTLNISRCVISTRALIHLFRSSSTFSTPL